MPQKLFITNTVISLIATAKFNQIALVALTPQSCTTLLCSFFTGIAVPVSGVVFFNIIHSLGFMGIYHLTKQKYQTVPVKSKIINFEPIKCLFKQISLILVANSSLTVSILMFLIGIFTARKFLKNKYV